MTFKKFLIRLITVIITVIGASFFVFCICDGGAICNVRRFVYVYTHTVINTHTCTVICIFDGVAICNVAGNHDI
jgi:hypothetical protein